MRVKWRNIEVLVSEMTQAQALAFSKNLNDIPEGISEEDGILRIVACAIVDSPQKWLKDGEVMEPGVYEICEEDDAATYTIELPLTTDNVRNLPAQLYLDLSEAVERVGGATIEQYFLAIRQLVETLTQPAN